MPKPRKAPLSLSTSQEQGLNMHSGVLLQIFLEMKFYFHSLLGTQSSHLH